jgi:thymidine kinase
MAKLYFRFGAMNCGKSTALMQVAHNYNENDMQVVVIKSSIDTKADDYLESRIGLKRKVDLLIDPDKSLEPFFEEWNQNIKAVLVDEAQFLTKNQVEELWMFSKLYDKPVICYGLKTDFQTNLFEGSSRLLELADELEELTTICRCGNKAKFNARFVDGEFASTGESIVIDGSYKNVEYKPMCGKCYIKKKYGRE